MDSLREILLKEGVILSEEEIKTRTNRVNVCHEKPNTFNIQEHIKRIEDSELNQRRNAAKE